MGKLVRYNFPNNIHFVTTSCHDRLPLFHSDGIKTLFAQSIITVRNKSGFKLFGYVIMPEHVHLLLQPQDKRTISDIMREVKQRCAFNALRFLKVNRPKTLLEKLRKKACRGKEQKYSFWKPRFYDFNHFSVKKFKEKLDYCHKNPVTRGLVNDPSDWRFSSFRNYHMNDNSIVSIDQLEISPSAQG